MWNPFLSAEDRASIRRGGELYRQYEPRHYWMSRVFIWVCALACAAILAFLLFIGAYWNALILVLFWAVVYIVTAFGVARNIRRL